MNVDRERLPRWGWLLLGLVATSMVAQLVNFLVFFPLGLGERYGVVTVIAAMAPVIVYVGIWYGEERRHYWEHSGLRIAADVAFLVLGTVAGAGAALVVLVDTGLPVLLQDLLGMSVGFVAGWALFYFRNPDLYFTGVEDRRS